MEYIEGEDLDTRRRRLGRLPYQEVVELLLPIIDALSYAHSLGIVHRDVKGSNIVIDRQGRPRLTDFGIAGVFQSRAGVEQAKTGSSVYSMSPQQWEGLKPHPSDDIYGLGVLTYELLTGHPPFHPDATPERTRGEIPLPVNSHLGPQDGIPHSLDTLVGCMLTKDPNGRPSSMDEVSQTLQSVLADVKHRTMTPAAGADRKTGEASLGGKAQVIAPVKVHAKGERGVSRASNRGPSLRLILAGLGLLVIVAGGVLLLSYVSRNPLPTQPMSTQSVTPDREGKGLPGEPVPAPPERADGVQIAREKRYAEERFSEFVQARKALDAKGAAHWGGELYSKVAALSKVADELFMEKEFKGTAERYAEAQAALEELEGEMESALRQLLDEGLLALEEGDGDLAQRRFSVALMIDSENLSAKRNLKRAKHVETVGQLIASGANHERAGSLALALADYEEALKLDSESEGAKVAFDRVKKQIAAARFQQLMSSGFAALQRGDYRSAQPIFLEAKSLRPGSTEVKDALAQVDSVRRLARIEALQKEALAAEKSESWERAIDSYAAVLEVDGSVQFAIEGKEWATKLYQVERRMDFYLEKPTALESDSYLDRAVALVTEAKGIDPIGPRLGEKLGKLEKLVALAQTPVRVTVESDSLTEVVVYKVGNLGRFQVRELKLRPGTYTIVGARSGYRDVRRKIVVKASEGSVRVTVKCSEKI
jgi:tetratricopeptide (TPR) repeat protein